MPNHLPAPRLVENISGLYALHAACAGMSRTPFFFLVDADNWILDGFDFAVPSLPTSDEVLVWGATNPFNSLYYGHGGMKLLPTAWFEVRNPGGRGRQPRLHRHHGAQSLRRCQSLGAPFRHQRLWHVGRGVPGMREAEHRLACANQSQAPRHCTAPARTMVRSQPGGALCRVVPSRRHRRHRLWSRVPWRPAPS